MKKAMPADGNRITAEMRRFYAPLADNLMCAFLSSMAGMAYPTVKKHYGAQATGVTSDYWILVAARTTIELEQLAEKDRERALAKLGWVDKKKGRSAARTKMPTGPKQEKLTT